MSRYHNLLQQIWNVGRECGMTPQMPCPVRELDQLRADCLHTFHCVLPEEYLTLLSISNGLEWNGLGIFASKRSLIQGTADSFIEGFVQANLDCREPGVLQDHLVFASDDTSYFTYDINTREYQVMLSGGLTLLQSFDTFDDLMCDALESHL